MTADFVEPIELPPGFLPLDPCDVAIGFGNVLPRGDFVTNDCFTYNFVVRRSGEIMISPLLPNNLDRLSVEWIESAIHLMVAGKRARRAAYRAELEAFSRKDQRARKRARAKQEAGR